ncbi:WxL protein peptidoglycan domain-containing protein [Kribbella sp. DT2]|uniref:WxL protein peptidoglycan domain-containing protein n=1 Tax=Kribbella sp. DT2 TaxID=3393427 RepID=UPI003CFB1337
MRSTRLLAAAVLAATSLSAVPASAADAPWSVQPADNAFGPDRQNYTYTVAPGEKVDDGLSVVNRGTTALDLAVYAADGFTTDTGQLDLRHQTEKATTVGAWVRPGLTHVKIQPGKSAAVPFTLTVPTDAAPGDHIGGIVTSVEQAGSEQRMGVRIQLRVGGELKPQLTVSEVQVHPPLVGGDATVTYTVHNTGNATVSARQTASLAGPFGQLRASATDVADSPALLPGDKWNATVAVKGVAAVLPLSADVTVTPLLTDAAGSTSQLASVDAGAHARVLPLVLIVVLLLLVAAGLIVRRRTVQRAAAR